MVDDLKNVRKQVFKLVTSNLGLGKDDESISLRDVLSTVAQIAGKGKDDVVNILCKEIGVAIAAMLKEPLNDVLETKELRVSFELVSKNKDSADKTTKKKTKKSSAKTKKS